MAQINVIRDPSLKSSKIISALRNAHTEGVGDGEVMVSETRQVQILGILTPLLAINSVLVDWNDVLEFALDDTGHLPSCTFRIRDRQDIFRRFSHVGNDNELRVQIIPQSDNTYKKMDLTFLITDIRLEGGDLSGSATYKLPAFTESRFKAMGSISTYQLMDSISLETGLGFAANVKETDDSRYMQCSFESYKDLITKEMNRSTSGPNQVLDWWVDGWNNLVLCDLYDRINSEDSEEDMKIWTTYNEGVASMNNESIPKKIPATFSNHPAFEKTDTYVFDFDVNNNPVLPSKGNTFAISIYEDNKGEWIDHYVADGDIARNEFIKYEYLGEVYGDYNYLLAEKCRNVYISKVKSEILMVRIPKPQLGIMRGSQCRFIWYNNDSMQAMNQKSMEDVGVLANPDELKTRIGWLADWDYRKKDPDNPLILNCQYSGQYTSIGQYMYYNGESQEWSSWLYLVRPASKRPIISQIDN